MPGYQYNGISLQYTKTLSLEMVQETDPTNTDALWMKYTIRVRGFLSREDISFPGVTDLSTNEIIALIKTQLETPRRLLIYNLTNISIIEQNGLDAQKGPWPLPAVVREVTNGIFMVECGCVTRIVECDNYCESGLSPVLSLRWTQTETFDQNWYSRLHTSGRLIVRSDLLQSADNFRTLATPGLLADYQRLSAEYTLSPDGLELQFDFVDQEADRLPPFGFTKASGTYQVRAERPGYIRLGTVSLDLEGQKGTSRKVLMIRAINMAYAKLYADKFFIGTGANQKPAPPLVWGIFREDLFECKVHVEMTGLMTNLAKPAALGISPGINVGIGIGILLAFPGFVGPEDVINVLAPGGGGGGGGAGGGAGAFDAMVPPNPALAAIAGGAAAAGIAAGFNNEIVKLPAPAVMPSVGLNTYGLQNNQLGIRPPDRKRIAGLLTALFADPCACVTATGGPGNAPPDTPSVSDRTIQTTPGAPSFQVNPNIVNPNPNPLAPAPGVPIVPGSQFVAPPNVFNPVPPQFTAPPNVGGGGGGAGGGAGGPSATYTVPAATINVAQLIPTNVANPLVIDQAPYDTYDLEIATAWDSGNVLLPGTGVGNNGIVASVVSAHGGMMKLITTWVAGRTGLPPSLPQFQTGDPNIVPLTGTIVAKDVVPAPDGAGLVYLMSGYYVHGVLDPRKYDMAPGVAPFLSTEVQQAATAAASFWQQESVAGIAANVLDQATNTNPFVPAGVTPQTPTVPSQLGGGTSSGNANSQSSAFFSPPASAGGVVEGDQGGSPYFQPPVNP